MYCLFSTCIRPIFQPELYQFSSTGGLRLCSCVGGASYAYDGLLLLLLHSALAFDEKCLDLSPFIEIHGRGYLRYYLNWHHWRDFPALNMAG